MIRLLFLIIILFICSLSLYSQGVVVSEYYNDYLSGSIKPDGEWAELIVTKDGINLAGCKIRDNSASDSWMAPFQFNDIDLWKNLHKGTIIVIYFKTSPVTDDNNDDGFIQVGAEDTKYFTYLGTNKQSSLNIYQARDMVQILDQSDNPIHTLAHAKLLYEALFNVIPVPNKICYSDELQSYQAVAVLPGSTLSEYDMGYDKDKKYTTKFSAIECSPGFPNKSDLFPTSNIDFWRSLRQPEWNNPRFSTWSVNSNGQVILNWIPVSNIATNPVEGYLLLRAEAKLWPSGSLPIDSKIYAKGDKIGSAVVVDYIQKFSSYTYIDKTGLECGKSYIYVLVAYRYNADYLKKDANELTARGRAYNETDYAVSSIITMEKPTVPKIYTDGNLTDICRGDELTIFLDETNLKGHTYQWIKDGKDTLGETANKIVVTKGGNYSIRITNGSGCDNESKVLKINLNDAPTVVIQEDKGSGQFKMFPNDTTIYLCIGSSLKMVAKIVPKPDNIQWLKDGNILQEGPNKFSFVATASGTYQVLAYNGTCYSESAILTVKIIEVNLRISPTSLTLDYDKNPTGTITITNLTEYELILQASDIKLPIDFSIINPVSAPFVIPAHYFLNFDIRFDTPDYKTVTGKMEINPPCGNQYTVDLTGTRKKPNSTYPIAELTNIDFGIVPNCLPKDTIFVIRLEGTDEVIMKSYKGTLNGYEVEFNPILPWKLNDGEIRVYIAFSNTMPGVYAEDILLDYTVAGVDATEPLKISLNGEKQIPKLDLLDDYTNFKFDMFGCDNTMDTIIRVTNQSPFDIRIDNNFNASQIKFKSLPIIIPSKDTVDLEVTLTAGIYIPTTFTYEPCSVKSETITVEISAVAPDMVFSIADNTMDFGIINNCQFPGDSIIKIAFSGNGVASSIGAIDIPQGIELAGLNVGDNVPTAGGQFNVIFKSDFIGNMDENIEITLAPCNIKKLINVKGSRYTPLAPIVSNSFFDFGDYILGDPFVEKILSITNNDTRDITIENIQGISAPFVLVNNDFPYLLKFGEKKDYILRYERTNESNSDILDIKVIFDSFCDFDKTIQLKGKASTGILPANIKLSIQSGVNIGLGKTVKVPVLIQVTDTTTLVKCGIKKVQFGIQYDSNVLDLVNATVGNAIKSKISSFSIVQKSLGNSEISFDVNPNYDIIPGVLAELEVLGLLGDTTCTAISIISPELFSDIRIINLEIENGSAKVIGQCELNNRLVSIDGGQGGIIAVEPNPVSDNVTLTIDVISDDLTQCGIYDYLGKNVQSIINESLKPDIYKHQINVSDLQSGVYYIVFKNGIIINTTKLIINK